MRIHFDAVIIGAGPAGTAAAILLARAGWSVALVEKQRFPRRKVCGECIAASNLPLLHLLGIGSAFDEWAGPPLRQVALMRGDQRVVADLPAAVHPAGGTPTAHRWGRPLAREMLDTLLLDQARRVGAELLQPWRVQAIAGQPGRWLCQVRATEADHRLTLRAPVLIAANGSWEALPCSRPVQRPAHAASDLLAFKANFEGSNLPDGLLPVLALAGGYGGMVVSEAGGPSGARTTTVACCVRRDRLDALRQAMPGARAGEVVEAWLKRDCSGVRRVLRSADRTGPWLAAGPIAPGMRLRPDDAMLRIGNAAGEAHPILGEGISMALQSAALLCQHLLARPPGTRLAMTALPGRVRQAEIAQTYAEMWRAHFLPRLRLAALFAHAAMRPAAAAPLLALAQAWPGVLALGARWGGKLHCVADLAALAQLAPAARLGPAGGPAVGPALSPAFGSAFSADAGFAGPASKRHAA